MEPARFVTRACVERRHGVECMLPGRRNARHQHQAVAERDHGRGADAERGIADREVPDLCRFPQTKRKSLACRLASATPCRVTVLLASWVIIVLPCPSSGGVQIGKACKQRVI